MCRVVSQELEPALHAVSQARGTVKAALARWELETLVPDAQLLVSELVTNALVHAGTETSLSLAVADGVLEVGVTDRAPGVPLARRAGEGSGTLGQDWRAEGGRGLRLVDLVADDWGLAVLAEGKQVWFRLVVDESWPHHTACPCSGEDLERVRLESGRYAVAVPGPWDAESPQSVS